MQGAMRWTAIQRGEGAILLLDCPPLQPTVQLATNNFGSNYQRLQSSDSPLLPRPTLQLGFSGGLIICQTLSFVTNFGNLTEQRNMCAKCNEHKYGLFSGVSVAPAAILSKVNFLTGSQVFYSCCTTPLYICCTTPPLFINMVILAVSPSLAGALYGNVQTKKLCGNGKQPLKSPLLAQLHVGKFDQIVNYLIQN